jgi:hypothetical protein
MKTEEKKKKRITSPCYYSQEDNEEHRDKPKPKTISNPSSVELQTPLIGVSRSGEAS